MSSRILTQYALVRAPLRVVAKHQTLLMMASSRQLQIVSCVQKQSFGSITYSGGQATEGQGGYYGSGGARANVVHEVDDTSSTGTHRKKMIALAHDVELIRSTMIELEDLEGTLRDKISAGVSSTDKEIMDLKHSIKKLMTTQAVLESLNNLEINGEPVWGLSTEERELIMLARAKVNEC